MTLFEALRVAIRALTANKLRAALTMLGMIIGVGAVIALMSVGQGVNAAVTENIQSMGTNLLFVRPGASQEGGVRGAQGSAGSLTLDDAEAISDPSNVPGVVLVAPETGTIAQIIAGSQNVSSRITGTTPEYENVRNHYVADGEFFGRQHIDGRSAVAVLGANVAVSLFGDDSPVGQTVSVGSGGRRLNFRVIGVMAAKGGTGFGNQDDLVLIPITTLQQRLFVQRSGGGQPNVNTINVQVASAAEMDQTVQDIAELLRQRHRVAQDDFTIQSQQEILQAFDQITGMMTMLLGSIAGISLVVGGIGIMNIMLVSVTERTREIGIRKAVGARRRDILTQFVIEAVVVSVVGGIIGILMGTGVSQLLAGVQIQAGQPLRTMVTLDAVMLAVGVSAAIGVFFGIYPAVRASRLNPIEALRYE
ncbi:MAG TPA: ABC transporter permease [Chloroflexota bacterium]|nr:ABC transporter permease [Chloroflexota bacterium]